ncbi:MULTISPECIES: hypothetical protein [Frankia]|uniref:Uncharacterized protein n=1 Tax=Frankia alni (strain DSM 45986 / CECT 9034 / ACN14a) TaxID=326424 RepID=Q0RU52_FRAAA|nr:MULTISPECIES: hypothetical protein [Frankia]CAJ58892.1 conserved hypothetical protein [Frankia alni ACN14a]
MDGSEPVHILITQCLQNDFFFNLNCRLHLPEDAAAKLLIHPDSRSGFGLRRGRRVLDARTQRSGPLGRMLSATVGARLGGGGRGVLHLVNVRDWHVPSDDYDRERSEYGTHCEAGTWGADYPDALVGLLDPTGTRPRAGGPGTAPFDPTGRRRGSVIVHHVHSNTLFDLREDASGLDRSELGEVLGAILPPSGHQDVRIAVVGLYTDIKVQLLLQSLRTSFGGARQVVVSDSLTAGVSLERHLAALDFARKVLRVEVMQGVSDLARLLGTDPGQDEELESAAGAVAFADYAEYFQAKQRIVSSEDAQSRSYRQQIIGRLDATVRLVTLTNVFLIVCGALTLGAAVVLAVLAAAAPGTIPVALPALVLGLSAVQVVSVFFHRPAQSLIQLLGREAIVRMSLESRSLRLALARYHLTTPDALHPDEGSGLRAELLQRQMDILAQMDRADIEAIEKLGGPVSPPDAPPVE